MLGASKIFAVLAIQSALLVFLSYRVIVLETRPAVAPVVEFTSKHNEKDVAQASNELNNRALVDPVNREETRQIIRDELDALELRLLDAIETTAASNPQSMPKQQRTLDRRELSEMNAAVVNKISNMMGNGSANQAEMAKLEQMIARLPPRDRIRAMGELNQAMNSGRLDVKY